MNILFLCEGWAPSAHETVCAPGIEHRKKLTIRRSAAHIEAHIVAGLIVAETEQFPTSSRQVGFSSISEIYSGSERC
jgi:hypothetical protein